MNLEVVLNYVTLHNQAVIQWLVVAILGLVGTLLALALFGRRESSADHASLANAGELAETLKKMMEQGAPIAGVTDAAADAATTAPAPAAAAPSGETSPAATERLRVLETELRQRDDEIAQLKAAKPTGGADQAQRLAELEAKLSEYEILEDDIADLSLYKEENTRLRAELESLKGDGGAPDPVVVAQPMPTPAAAAAIAEPAPEPSQPARTAEAAAEAAASFAAFEAAAESIVETPAPAPAPTQHDLNAGADDLFAEFATALEESGVDLSVAEPAKTSA